MNRHDPHIAITLEWQAAQRKMPQEPKADFR